MGPEIDWGAERVGCHPGRSQRDRSRRRHGCVVDPAGHPSEHVDELGGRHTRMGLRQRRLESDGHRPLRHLPRDGGCRCDRRDNRQRSGNRGNRASQRHGRPGARIERRGHLHGHRPGHHLGSRSWSEGDQSLAGHQRDTNRTDGHPPRHRPCMVQGSTHRRGGRERRGRDARLPCPPS